MAAVTLGWSRVELGDEGSRAGGRLPRGGASPSLPRGQGQSPASVQRGPVSWETWPRGRRVVSAADPEQGLGEPPGSLGDRGTVWERRPEAKPQVAAEQAGAGPAAGPAPPDPVVTMQGRRGVVPPSGACDLQRVSRELGREPDRGWTRAGPWEARGQWPWRAGAELGGRDRLCPEAGVDPACWPSHPPSPTWTSGLPGGCLSQVPAIRCRW